jgi:hypothetical protein
LPSQKVFLNADFAGIQSSTKLILCFKLVNAEGVSSIYISNALEAGLKPRNIDRLVYIIQAYTGDNFSVKYASLLCRMFSEITGESIA